MRGLEPPRPYGHTDLNRARLPIPPHPRGSNDSSSGSSHLSMTRLAAFAATALALLSLTLGVTSDDAAARTEVVVLLESRPLALDADAAATIEVEQRTFRRELAREVPDARVGWSYRLVANGFSVSLPESEVPKLRALAGVRDVLAAGEVRAAAGVNSASRSEHAPSGARRSTLRGRASRSGSSTRASTQRTRSSTRRATQCRKASPRDNARSRPRR